ncbi:MAG: ACP phosphodiesterase [Campylobacterota bacterium]|nr:ACP phosphodiesterase [Campylobacterota bacterium]
MNWLAHVFLSEQKIDFQIGNFLADPLKGKLWDSASADMQKGVDIHKIIDSYTDSHKIVSISKARLREKGLLKPVIVDLTYDYFLTKNWNMFSSIPIKEFLESFNKEAKKRSNDLPTQASELVANLADEDRLNKYHDLDQLKKAFERIDTRLSKKLLLRESAVGYFDIVNEKINDLESDFLIFFPDLCIFLKKDLNQNNLNHWRI